MTSPLSSTTSLRSLALSSAASTPGSFSLDRYHEPSTLEKMRAARGQTALPALSGAGVNTGALAHPHTTPLPRVALPPISSFDNLVRAAAEQVPAPQLDAPAFHLASGVPRPAPSDSLASSRNSSTGGFGGDATSPPAGELRSPTASAKVSKPRRKKECPICHNMYANLSTHKSTHLTPENRPHRCPVCERGFARNNDLIRHKKRHWRDGAGEDAAASVPAEAPTDSSVSPPAGGDTLSQAAPAASLKSLHQIKGTFKCPYNAALIRLDMEVYPHKAHPLPFETSACHQTGVFSRCDTYKNHLKALHFEYPPGTKKKDRGIVPGRCKHCGDKFENVDIWLNKHVGKACGYSYH